MTCLEGQGLTALATKRGGIRNQSAAATFQPVRAAGIRPHGRRCGAIGETVKVVGVFFSSLAVVALVGCGATTTATNASSPTPTSATTSTVSPTPTSLASLGVVVIEPQVWNAPRATYFVAILGLDGRIRASARPSVPTALCCYPVISVAGSHVYYLDGNTKLMRLDLDGSTAQVAALPGGSHDRVVVAVDPASGRIAFGVAHIGPNTCPSQNAPGCTPPVSTQLWVAAPDGSGARKLPIHRFPVAWHAGRIVVGPAGGFLQNRGETNPYLAGSLGLVDPATGHITDMTASCGQPEGPLGPAGIACEHSSATFVTSVTALGWDGHETILASSPPSAGSAALSPDGTMAAVSTATRSGSGTWTFDLMLAKGGQLTSLHVSAAPVGWLDATHLLVNTNLTPSVAPTYEILDVATGGVVTVDLAGNRGYVDSAGYFSAFPSE